MKLKTKFTLIVSIFVINILALTAFFAFSHYKRAIKETIAQQQFRLVSILADEIDNKLLAAQQQIVDLAEITPADIMRNPAKAQAFLDGNPGVHTILDGHFFLFTPSGKIFVESPYSSNRRGLDLSYRQYMINTIKSGKPYISDPFEGSQSHHPVLMFTVPLFDGKGNIRGILAGSLDLLRDNFMERIGTVKVGETGDLHLAQADGTIIIHPDKKKMLHKQPRGLNKLFDAAVNGFEGTGETTSSYGIATVSSFKRLKTKDWILSANYPSVEAYRPIRQLEQYFLMSISIGIITLFFIISFIIKYLTKPLELFTRHIEDLSQKKEGDRFLNIKAKDEIGMLSAAFNKMETERERAEVLLSESEERYRRLFEMESDAILLVDCGTGRIIEANASAQNLYGYNKEEFLVLKDTDVSAEPEKTERAIRERQIRIPLRWHRKKDGVVFPVEIAGSKFECRGRIIHVAAIRDITERKRAETSILASEKKYRELVENLYEGVCAIDNDYITTFVSSRMSEMLGYTVEELLGNSIIPFIESLGRDEAASYLRGRQLAARERRRLDFLRKDGTILPTSVSVSPLTAGDRSDAGAIICVVDITERLQLEQKIQQISSTERHRIGRDLHDDLGQHLTGMAFMSKVLAQKLALKSLVEATDAEALLTLVNEAIYKTQILSRGLCPMGPGADNFISGLNMLTSKTAMLYGIPCSCTIDSAIMIHDNNQAMQLYFIAKEAINNAIKHGGAKNIAISMTAGDGKISLTIKDDGVGFHEKMIKKGLGLDIMNYRAGMINAWLSINNDSSGGTVVRCTFHEDDGKHSIMIDND